MSRKSCFFYLFAKEACFSFVIAVILNSQVDSGTLVVKTENCGSAQDLLRFEIICRVYTLT